MRPLSLGKISPDYAQQLSNGDVFIDLTVHPALLPALVEWLDSRGLDITLVDRGDIETMPNAVVSPRRL